MDCVLFTDSEDPEIICADDFDINEWPMPVATDNSGDVPQLICHLQLHANASTDQANVTCEAIDGSGNRAECNSHDIVSGTFCRPIYRTKVGK